MICHSRDSLFTCILTLISLAFVVVPNTWGSPPDGAPEALLSDTATDSSSGSPSGPSPSRSPRLMLISWDGAGDVLIDRLLAEGKMPHLKALAERGVRAEHMIGTWPSKTAPSHASIYTGCGPGTHGVSGNMTVYSKDRHQHSVRDAFRGFSALALQAEPLFVTTALEGLDTTVLGATHYFPHSPIAAALESRKAESRFRSLSSFEQQILPSGALGEEDLNPVSEPWTDVPPWIGQPLELELQVGDDAVYGWVFDHPDDPTQGYDSVLLRLNSRTREAGFEALLKPHAAADQPRGWSRGFPIRDGSNGGLLYFRLFQLAPDGSEMILYRREVNTAVGSISERDRAAYMASGAASYDDAFHAYRFGRLGRPMMLGGDGSAEARLLETVTFDVDHLIANSRFAWTEWRPEALFHYAPYLDHAGHQWMAVLHPDSEIHDPELGEAIWGVYSKIAAQLDRWLGELVEMAGDDTILALVSDHGMTYSTRDVAINRILEQEGLLTRDTDGRIDLSRTKILASESSFFLRLNELQWREGIVADDQRAEVLAQAATALLSAKDPETGRSVIRRIHLSEEVSHLQLDRFGGDLYLDPAPGYYPISGFPEAVAGPSGRPWGGGTHGNWPENRDMHAIFFIAGPGVAEQVTVPAMSQIDVAPTLSALLGIRPPAQACGRVVFETLRKIGPQEIGPQKIGLRKTGIPGSNTSTADR